MGCRRLPLVHVLAGASLVVAALGFSPAVASATVARASGASPSLDLCLVLPGFATPGDSFTLHSTGPKNFDESGQLSASACGSYAQVPKGKYTVTQTDTASGWHLAQIYCYATGASDKSLGTVDLGSNSVSLTVNQPVSCLFAQLSGGGGGSSSSTGSGFGGKSSTTTTTTKGTTTTKPPVKTFCQLHPALCSGIKPIKPLPVSPGT